MHSNVAVILVEIGALIVDVISNTQRLLIIEILR